MNTRDHTLSTDLATAGGVLACGLILGAGLMAILDPQVGRGRRAMARQKTRRLIRLTGETLEGQRKDLVNRTRGLMAASRARIRSRRETPDDITLISRVRATLGRICSHPHAIDVQACNGCVTVWGPILEQEADPLISAIWKIPGVTEVEDQLQRHSDPRHIPALQGGRTRPGVAARGSSRMVRGLSLLGLAGLVAGGIYALIPSLAEEDEEEETDQPPAPFATEEMDAELDDIDQMERQGVPPDWVLEREEHIVLDRRR